MTNACEERSGSRFGETRLDLYEALWAQLPQIKMATFRFKDFLSGARDSPLVDELMVLMLRELSSLTEGLHDCLLQFEAHLGEELRQLHQAGIAARRKQWGWED